mgnify:CR=1 FL=1
MTTIELTDKEACLFILFRKYQDQFEYLILQGFFETRGGNVTVHFNVEGHIITGEMSRSWEPRQKRLDTKIK